MPLVQKIASLIYIPDSFKKIVVVKDYIKPWRDEHGIQYVGVKDFLLDKSLIFLSFSFFCTKILP